MKNENRSKEGKGWHEDADPTCIVKGKAVAKRHHEIAVRDKLKETLRTPFALFKPKDGEAETELENVDEAIEKEQEESIEPTMEDDELMTLSFKELTGTQRELLEEQLGGDGNDIGLCDLITDNKGHHAIVQKSKEPQFRDFLESIGCPEAE